MRGLDSTQRNALLAQVSETGDRETLHALISAPVYLTGLSPHLIAHYRDQLEVMALPNEYGTRHNVRIAIEAGNAAIHQLHAHIAAVAPRSEVARIEAALADAA